jgi:hypothetical protein
VAQQRGGDHDGHHQPDHQNGHDVHLLQRQCAPRDGLTPET